MTYAQHPAPASDVTAVSVLRTASSTTLSEERGLRG